MCRLYLSAIILMCLGGCDLYEGGLEGYRILPVSTGQPPAERQDALDIEEVSISGDILALKVSHSGGCEEHTYGLAWDETFEESNPTQEELIVTHDAHGDSCEALISATLSFDLTPLKQRWREQYRSEHGTIVLRFVRSPATVRYEF